MSIFDWLTSRNISTLQGIQVEFLKPGLIKD